jgi:hypothetical protein
MIFRQKIKLCLSIKFFSFLIDLIQILKFNTFAYPLINMVILFFYLKFCHSFFLLCHNLRESILFLKLKFDC